MNFSSRTALLLGPKAMQALATRRVLVVGVGGVGSWCAESLVRCGLVHLTMVDGDIVCESNINRQSMATHSTIGRPKVEVLRQRLLDINPEANVTAIHRFFSQETAHEFALDTFDYIIDCIDSLTDKMNLLVSATATQARVYSSMGAALKMDPLRVRVADLWHVRGCPLGAALRKKMHRTGNVPSREVTCVYSDEVLQNQGESEEKANGSLVQVTATFGLTLSSLVLRDITTTV